MKKLICALLCLTLLFSLAGCGATLDEAFDEEQVESAALAVVDLIVARDYQAISDLAQDDLKDKLSAEVLSSALDDYMSGKGEFEEVRSTETVGKTSEDGTPYAVCLVTVKLSAGTAKIAVSLGTDYKLVGLYVY